MYFFQASKKNANEKLQEAFLNVNAKTNEISILKDKERLLQEESEAWKKKYEDEKALYERKARV